MSTTESPKGRGILMIAHVAGMIDLVALPIRVGALAFLRFGSALRSQPAQVAVPVSQVS